MSRTADAVFDDGHAVVFLAAFHTFYADGRPWTVPARTPGVVQGVPRTQIGPNQTHIITYTVELVGTDGLLSDMVEGVPEYLLEAGDAEPEYEGKAQQPDAPEYQPSGAFDSRKAK